MEDVCSQSISDARSQQNNLVKLIKIAFDRFGPALEENVFKSTRALSTHVLRLNKVQAMHFPKDLAEYKMTLRQVNLKELLFQLQLQVLKEKSHCCQRFPRLESRKLAEQKKTASPLS